MKTSVENDPEKREGHSDIIKTWGKNKPTALVDSQLSLRLRHVRRCSITSVTGFLELDFLGIQTQSFGVLIKRKQPDFLRICWSHWEISGIRVYIFDWLTEVLSRSFDRMSVRSISLTNQMSRLLAVMSISEIFG